MTRGTGRFLTAAGVLTDAYGTVLENAPAPEASAAEADAPKAGAPPELPGLSGMNKAELVAQAQAEGVEFSAAGLTNDEMRAEIESARA